jgi:hypothetical protein
MMTIMQMMINPRQIVNGRQSQDDEEDDELESLSENPNGNLYEEEDD